MEGTLHRPLLETVPEPDAADIKIETNHPMAYTKVQHSRWPIKRKMA